MRGKQSKPRRRKGKDDAISRLPEEERLKLEGMAKSIGMNVPRPGQALDEQYTTPKSASSSSSATSGITLYQRLAGIFGVETLDSMEGGFYYVLGGLLVAFLISGLLIASEAFFKASKEEIPAGLDSIVLTAEQWFTPLLLFFVAASSLFGIYKQSQLNSGAAQYDENRPPRSR